MPRIIPNKFWSLIRMRPKTCISIMLHIIVFVVWIIAHIYKISIEKAFSSQFFIDLINIIFATSFSSICGSIYAMTFVTTIAGLKLKRFFNYVDLIYLAMDRLSIKKVPDAKKKEILNKIRDIPRTKISYLTEVDDDGYRLCNQVRNNPWSYELSWFSSRSIPCILYIPNNFTAYIIDDNDDVYYTTEFTIPSELFGFGSEQPIALTGELFIESVRDDVKDNRDFRIINCRLLQTIYDCVWSIWKKLSRFLMRRVQKVEKLRFMIDLGLSAKRDNIVTYRHARTKKEDKQHPPRPVYNDSEPFGILIKPRMDSNFEHQKCQNDDKLKTQMSDLELLQPYNKLFLFFDYYLEELKDKPDFIDGVMFIPAAQTGVPCYVFRSKDRLDGKFQGNLEAFFNRNPTQ